MKLGETVLNDYWLKYYASEPGPKGRCTLCGNSGIIDTRGAMDATGHEVGRMNYCICPNGQEARRLSKTIVLPCEYVYQSIEPLVTTVYRAQIDELERQNKTLRDVVARRETTIKQNGFQITRLTEQRDNAYEQAKFSHELARQAENSARKWKRYYHELLTRVSALQSMLDRVEIVDPRRAERYDKMEREGL